MFGEDSHFDQYFSKGLTPPTSIDDLGSGLKVCFLFTPVYGEMIQFDEHIFQMGLFNRQPVFAYKRWPSLADAIRNLWSPSRVIKAYQKESQRIAGKVCGNDLFSCILRNI